MKERSEQKPNVVVVVLIVVGIILFGAGVAWLFMKFRPEPETRKIADISPLVAAVVAENREHTVTVKGFGTVRARRRVTVAAEVAGKIVMVSPKIEAGMFFTNDDLLLEIDRRSYELAVKRIERLIEQQQAETERIRQERANGENDLKIFADELAIATKEWKRQKDLKASNVVAETAVEAARIAYLRTKQRKQTVENTLAVIERQIAVVNAQLARTRVELDQAELSLSKTRLLAPFDGRTAKKLIEQDQYVMAGTPLFKIYDTSVAEVTVQVPVEDLRWLTLANSSEMKGHNASGNPTQSQNTHRAYAYLDTGNNIASWQGFVARLGGVVSETTRTVPVVVLFPDPWGGNQSDTTTALMPGMFVSIEIRGKTYSYICKLPRGALRTNSSVYIVDNGTLRIRPVKVLRTEGNFVLIEAGIEDGDVIITSPISTATDGMKIRTTGEEVEIKGEK